MINVPIVKHHCLADSTLCMKNYMGVIENRKSFHQDIPTCLADVTRFMKPQICILDAVRILTAHGPIGGKLEDVALKYTVAAGVDIVALDAWGRRSWASGQTSARSSRATPLAWARSITARWRCGRSRFHELAAARIWTCYAGPATGATIAAAVILRLGARHLLPRRLRSRAWLKLFFLIDPLILVATWLTTHTLVAAGLWALATVAVTIVMGRVFCGWVCPLGTLHSIAGWIFDRVWPDRKRRDHWSPWQRAKYYLLVGFLAMAALGGHWVCVVDPIVLLYRSTATALLPATQWALEETSTAIYRSDPGVGSLRLAKLTEPAYQAIRTTAFNVEKQAFLGGGVMLAIFVPCCS